jgi:hypothetical protein
MPDLCAFDYTVVRVVPHVEQEEFLNAGVILLCRERSFLGGRVRLDRARLASLAPELDLATVQAHLELIPRICAGGPQAGPLGDLSQAERFRWLASPHSTVIQVSAVHCGLCLDPQAVLEDLMRKMIG